MAVPEHKMKIIRRRRALVHGLISQGKRGVDVARKLGISQQMVQADLKAWELESNRVAPLPSKQPTVPMFWGLPS